MKRRSISSHRQMERLTWVAAGVCWAGALIIGTACILYVIAHPGLI